MFVDLKLDGNGVDPFIDERGSTEAGDETATACEEPLLARDPVRC